MPLVVACTPLPVPNLLIQPRPCSSIGAASGSGRRGPDRRRRLAEGVAAGRQGDRFFVVHRHAGEGLADVAAGSDRIGVAVRAFGLT
jgi:hypothetical protein